MCALISIYITETTIITGRPIDIKYRAYTENLFDE